MKKCTECNDVGYFINVIQYNADGLLECDNGTERCDECQVFRSDTDAHNYHFLLSMASDLKGSQRYGQMDHRHWEILKKRI